MPLPRRLLTTLRASRALALACCFAASGAAFAQLVENLDWKESEVPPPPSFELKRLVQVETPAYSTVRYAVDPATIVITGDGVVRYVVVATGTSGAVNAFYEGVRCATAEMKTYARYTPSEWHAVSDPDWKRIRDMGSRHTAAIASQGLCRGEAPRLSVADIVGHIKNPIREME